MSSADKYADSRKFIREKCAEKIDLMYGLKDIDPLFADTLRKMVETQLDYEIDEIEKHGLLEEFMAMSDSTEFVKDSGYILHPGGWGTSSTVAFILGITDIDPMAYGLVFNPKALKESRLYLSVPAHQRSEIRKALHLMCANRKMFIYGHEELQDIFIALERIKENNSNFDFNAIPLNDRMTFDLIGNGNVDGIPYLQCPQGRGLCRRICPRNLDEHIALISFIHNPLSTVFIATYLSAKPAPENIDYAHPEIGMILGETYGIMLYREQAVLIMEKLSGIPYDNAWDILKELMGKGNIELHMERFIKGCNSKCGIDRKSAFGIWEMIMSCPMSSKAYYVQKSVLTYKMAYLRANYRDKFCVVAFNLVDSCQSLMHCNTTR